METKEKVKKKKYKNTYTTGPFLLPQNTHSIDWGILNNDPIQQKVRVTVFKCNIGSTKSIEPPGPLEITLEHGETSHNANNAVGGFYNVGSRGREYHRTCPVDESACLEAQERKYETGHLKKMLRREQ
jgi:hypothetical protein